MKRAKLLVLASVLLSNIVCAQSIDPVQYRFEWDKAPLSQVVTDLSKAFNVTVFLGEGLDTQVSGSLTAIDFDNALTGLSKTVRLPWTLLETDNRDLSYSQAALLARIKLEFKGFSVRVSDQFAGSLFIGTINGEQLTERKTDRKAYFLGYPNQNLSVEDTEQPFADWQYSLEQESVYSTIQSWSPEERARLRKFLFDLDGPEFGDKASAEEHPAD